MQKRTFVTAPMPHELAKRARIAAAELEIAHSELIRQAVKEFLDRKDIESD